MLLPFKKYVLSAHLLHVKFRADQAKSPAHIRIQVSRFQSCNNPPNRREQAPCKERPLPDTAQHNTGPRLQIKSAVKWYNGIPVPRIGIVEESRTHTPCGEQFLRLWANLVLQDLYLIYAKNKSFSHYFGAVLNLLYDFFERKTKADWETVFFTDFSIFRKD